MMETREGLSPRPRASPSLPHTRPFVSPSVRDRSRETRSKAADQGGGLDPPVIRGRPSPYCARFPGVRRTMGRGISPECPGLEREDFLAEIRYGGFLDFIG